jgi:hypothetical protein
MTTIIEGKKVRRCPLFCRYSCVPPSLPLRLKNYILGRYIKLVPWCVNKRLVKGFTMMTASTILSLAAIGSSPGANITSTVGSAAPEEPFHESLFWICEHIRPKFRKEKEITYLTRRKDIDGDKTTVFIQNVEFRIRKV